MSLIKKPKKQAVKAGVDVIIKSEHVKLFKDLIDKEQAVKFAMGTMAEMLKERHQAFWNTVNELYPEIKDWVTAADLEEERFHVLYEKTAAWSKRHAKEAGLN